MVAAQVERIAELFSLISLAILSLVPLFFYVRNRIRRRPRPQEAPAAGEARSQRTTPQPEGAARRPAASTSMQGIQEARAEPERRELRLFEQATIERRERARARIAEAEAGALRPPGGAARGRVGWRRIDTLPPLKRAVVLSEVLGRPRGLSDEGPGEF